MASEATAFIGKGAEHDEALGQSDFLINELAPYRFVAYTVAHRRLHAVVEDAAGTAIETADRNGEARWTPPLPKMRSPGKGTQDKVARSRELIGKAEDFALGWDAHAFSIHSFAG
jgi:hypothetical protein